MAVKKKRGYKRLTLKEKEFNREWKKEAIEKGYARPPKKPLNRKKFAKEVWKELEDFGLYSDFVYITKAISYILPSGNVPVSTEEVGALKLIKVAIELKKFYTMKSEQGITEITIGEIVDEVLLPIKNL